MFICSIVLTLGILTKANSNEIYTSFEEHFESGVTHYWAEEWQSAIDEFQLALTSYKKYQDGIYRCYIKCQNVSIDLNNEHKQFHELKFIIKKASCTRTCLDGEFTDSRLTLQISEHIKHLFKILRPYVYLQYAYFQVGELENAVKSAFTYWLRHQGDEIIEDSMDYYRKLPEVTEDFMQDLEAPQHMVEYFRGVDEYSKENYVESIVAFKNALKLYYSASDKCNSLCEGEHVFDYDYPDVPSFHMQTADHYIQVTECSLTCVQELATDEAFNKISDYLPLHYHYLQFSLYQEGDILGALQYAKSYLVFHPDDEVMNVNVKLFEKEVKTLTEPLLEAVQYKKRIDIQVALLRYSYQSFGYEYKTHLLEPFSSQQEVDLKDGDLFEDIFQEKHLNDNLMKKPLTIPKEEEEVEEEGYLSFKQKQEDIIHLKSIENEIQAEIAEKFKRDVGKYEISDDEEDVSGLPIGKLVNSRGLVTIEDAAAELPLLEGNLLSSDYVLTANSTQLRGPDRFVIDKLINQNECEDLINLELFTGTAGDGYSGSKQPHTAFELFEGTSILKVAKLAEKGDIPYRIAKLYFDVSERARAQVQEYFHLQNLYFDYTHLVCRTALPDSREDLSHPVHADNCLLQSDGSCVKEPPAYLWRDYSAILYLNSNFEGGNLMFLDSTAKRVRAEVRPKCGRLAGFCAGKECFHGVRPVTKGQRCAMALWFSTHKEQDEKQRKEAYKLLQAIENRKSEL